MPTRQIGHRGQVLSVPYICRKLYNKNIGDRNMENKKEPIKIRLSTVILIFIIFILIIAIVGIIMYYNTKKIDKGNIIEDTQIDYSGTENKIEEKELSEFNINDTRIKKMYECIPMIDSNKISKNAYQDLKVTKEDLTTEFLLECAYSKLDLSEEDKQPIDGMTIDSGWYTFDADLLQEKVKEMYGTKIKNVSFEIGYGKSCSYQNSNNKYFYSVGGGSAEELINIRNIEKAYEEEDNIYIEDRYMVFEGTDSKYKLYTSSDNKKLIDDIDSSILTKTNEDIITELKNKYNSSMRKYKHTFKKGSDGNYYWYSTEPIE